MRLVRTCARPQCLGEVKGPPSHNRKYCSMHCFHRDRGRKELSNGQRMVLLLRWRRVLPGNVT